MGVDRTDYLMYGVKIDPDAVDWDKHEALLAGQPGRPFDLVYDGMSGEYAVAGKIIAQSSDYEGMVFTEITEELLPQDPDALRANIQETVRAGAGQATAVPVLALLLTPTAPKES